MCGIVGTNFLTKNFDKSIDLLKHRGPDNQSSIIYTNNQFQGNYAEACFGHTRLSIIDLDREANQPMDFDDIIITFNGEIYNYKELIKSEKLECKTKSDTEVIIRLYQKYNINFLNKLNGMFSFCIYDKNLNRFFCARDRFGKKPLYYYNKNGKFIYASEIKSILNLLETLPTLNELALNEYLSFWAPIGKNTFYKDINKLQAGHYLLLENNQLLINKYYDIDDIKTLQNTKEKTLKDIEQLLEDSVKLRLVSDVDIAALLSGGLDSSFISALYSKISKKKIDTYCIGYDEYLYYSELNYAKTVSTHINSNHHEIIIGQKEFINSIEDMIYHLDEPLGDSACIPTYLLSNTISKDKFKVALSGEGSDEVFFGYDKYFQLLDKNTEFQPINTTLLLEDKKKLLQNFKNIDLNFLDKYEQKDKQLSYMDFKIWIAEVLMTKVDKMSMANSLEIRTPFLDYNLVEYLFSVDSKLRVGKTNKQLLKDIATKYLPKEIVNRQKKGFSSPFNEWLHKEYKDEIQKQIIRVNKQTNFFNEDYIKFLYNESKENRYKQHIWNIFNFSKWFEKVYL